MRTTNMTFFFWQPVSDDFADLFKEVLRGELPVRFEAEMTAVWDLKEVLRQHTGEWPREFNHVFHSRDIEEPEGGCI
jgi:hypothetical protein